MINLPEYIDKKVMPEPMSGCWLWLGSLDKDGYGKTTYTDGGLKRHVRTHRIVYELLCQFSTF